MAGTITVGPGGETSNFACAIAGEGPYCWGINSLGELGTGTATATAFATPQPVALDDPLNVTSISAGRNFACAIQDGGVYCWGANGDGQLGRGMTNLQPNPVPVLIPSLASGVTEITTGQAHACAVQNGVVKCWGAGGFGQLGQGAPVSSPTPVTVVDMLPADNPRNLATGPQHTCVVKTAAGSLHCWGRGDEGQLGDDTTLNNSLIPVPVFAMDSGVTAVSGGQGYTCAVKSGQAFCWGRNERGQLGNGTTTGQPLPTPVSQMAANVTDIGAGLFHACATRFDPGAMGATMHCWGSNHNRALGLPSTIDFSTVPVPIALGNRPVAEIAVGYLTTCLWAHPPLFMEDDGLAAHCWGSGASGQLGNAAFSNFATPQRVSNIGYAGTPAGDQLE